MKGCCPMAEATGGTGAKAVVTDQDEQAVPPGPRNGNLPTTGTASEAERWGPSRSPFKMLRLHLRPGNPSATKASQTPAASFPLMPAVTAAVAWAPREGTNLGNG